MLIRYNLYRAKNPDVVFNSEMIEFVIETDEHLVHLDDILIRLLAQHINNLPQIKKYGIAYVDRMVIHNIEITDKDNVNLNEEQFRHFISTINPNLRIVWSKTDNITNNDEKGCKTEPNT